MKSSLFQSFNDAMKTPWKAFAIGSTVAAVVLATAWLISGNDLDEIWIAQLWLVPFVGLFCAGVSARLNPSRWRRWLSRFVITAFLISGIYTIATLGPLLAGIHDPPLMFAILAGVITLLYHAVLGSVALVLSAGSCVFMKRHSLTS